MPPKRVMPHNLFLFLGGFCVFMHCIMFATSPLASSTWAKDCSTSRSSSWWRFDVILPCLGKLVDELTSSQLLWMVASHQNQPCIQNWKISRSIIQRCSRAVSRGTASSYLLHVMHHRKIALCRRRTCGKHLWHLYKCPLSTGIGRGHSPAMQQTSEMEFLASVTSKPCQSIVALHDNCALMSSRNLSIGASFL